MSLIGRAVTGFLALFAVCVAFAVLLLAEHAVAEGCRWLRFQFARAFRRGPIRPDGDPLRPDEVAAFVDIVRGYGKRAQEPAYRTREERP